jgi:ferredoxin-NADP reductase
MSTPERVADPAPPPAATPPEPAVTPPEPARPPVRPSEPVRPDPLFRGIATVITAMRRIGELGRVRVPEPVNRDLPMRVDGVRLLARDVAGVRLTHRDGAELPGWTPGAHLDLLLPSGRLRQYSLCGDPADRYGYRIAVRRLPDGGGGSREVHELRAGTELVVRGPREAFPLVRASRYLFVAGGIGITPILPMVRAVAGTGADWHLVYTGRHRGLMPFAAELSGYGDRVTIRADAERGGPPTGAELLAAAPGPGTVAYLCGPPPMVSAVRTALGTAAGDVTALHTERFAPPPVLGGLPFVVELARDGTRLQVPAERTVLDVVREHRPDTPYSCRQGFCGTCRVRVLAGRVEHRDRVLTAAERAGSMTVCVSRAETDRLVLDL